MYPGMFRYTVVDYFFCRPKVFYVFLSNVPNDSGDFMSPTFVTDYIFLPTSHYLSVRYSGRPSERHVNESAALISVGLGRRRSQIADSAMGLKGARCRTNSVSNSIPMCSTEARPAGGSGTSTVRGPGS